MPLQGVTCSAQNTECAEYDHLVLILSAALNNASQTLKWLRSAISLVRELYLLIQICQM